MTHNTFMESFHEVLWTAIEYVAGDSFVSWCFSAGGLPNDIGGSYTQNATWKGCHGRPTDASARDSTGYNSSTLGRTRVSCVNLWNDNFGLHKKTGKNSTIAQWSKCMCMETWFCGTHYKTPGTLSCFCSKVPKVPPWSKWLPHPLAEKVISQSQQETLNTLPQQRYSVHRGKQ